ncbi:hypothetical protein RI367_002838 [Sorochytrium milnesiophthora]
MIRAPVFPLTPLPKTEGPHSLVHVEQQQKGPVRPLSQYLHAIITELTSSSDATAWLDQDEFATVTTIFISELVLRFYPAIRALTPKSLVAADNQTVLMHLFDNVRVIRDNALLKCQQQLMRLREEGLLPEEVNFQRIQEAAILPQRDIAPPSVMKNLSQRDRLVQDIKRSMEAEQRSRLMEDERARLKTVQQRRPTTFSAAATRIKTGQPGHAPAGWAGTADAARAAKAQTYNSDELQIQTGSGESESEHTDSDSEFHVMVREQARGENSLLLATIHSTRRTRNIASPQRKHVERYLVGKGLQTQGEPVDYDALSNTHVATAAQPERSVFRGKNELSPAQARLSDNQSAQVSLSLEELTFNLRDSNLEQDGTSAKLDDSSDALDVQLVRAKEVEELYEEIMASVVDDHLQAVEPPHARLYPFIHAHSSVDVSEILQMPPDKNSELSASLGLDEAEDHWGGRNRARSARSPGRHHRAQAGDRPSSSPAVTHRSRATTPGGHDVVRTVTEARVQLMTRQASQHEIHVFADEFANNRELAMRKTPSSRISALKYNFGGYVPQAVKTIRQRVLSPKDYRSFLRTRRTDFVYEMLYGKAVAAEEEAERQRLLALVEARARGKSPDEQTVEFEPGLWNSEALELMVPSESPRALAPLVNVPLTMPPNGEKQPNETVREEGSADDETGHNAAAAPAPVDPSVSVSLAAAPDVTAGGPRAAAAAPTNGPAVLGGEATAALVPEQEENTLQRRLERIWLCLHMPVRERLDMALKYAGDRFVLKLEKALETWEPCVAAIQQREQVLHDVKVFEWRVYDPERFFMTDHQGSSEARMEEARTRERLLRRLHDCDAEVSRQIQSVWVTCRDVVTYAGRRYADKMGKDYSELLVEISGGRKGWDRVLQRANE